MSPNPSIYFLLLGGSILSIRWSMNYHRHSDNSANQHVHSNPSGQFHSPTTLCILETKTISMEFFSLPLFLLKSHRNDKLAKKMEICFHIKLFPVNAFTHPLPNMIFRKMKYSHKKPCRKPWVLPKGNYTAVGFCRFTPTFPLPHLPKSKGTGTKI